MGSVAILTEYSGIRPLTASEYKECIAAAHEFVGDGKVRMPALVGHMISILPDESSLSSAIVWSLLKNHHLEFDSQRNIYKGTA